MADAPAAQTATSRMMDHFTSGSGAAMMRWGDSGALDRCTAEMGKYVGDKVVGEVCARMQKMASDMHGSNMMKPGAGKAPGK